MSETNVNIYFTWYQYKWNTKCDKNYTQMLILL